MNKTLAVLVMLMLLSAARPIVALEQGDLERERRLRDEIVDMIFDGEAITLSTADLDFLGILTEADSAKAGVIILHGRGFHPDWQEVVNPLRVGLVEHGWTTLSLQMPVLEKDATYYDYVPLFDAAIPRIEAGIAYLRELGLEKMILIAHSCGVHMAMHWIDVKGSDEIDAYIGLGMGATDYRQYMAKPFPLDKISVPVFDLYGENDFPAVHKMAPDRSGMIKQAGNPHSAQKMLAGADHYFTDSGEALLTEVSGWLAGLKF